MSLKERDRLEVLGRVKRKELTVTEAAELLEMSLRQTRRRWKRYRADGAAGLVHRLRGRASNRRFAEEFRRRVLKRRQERSCGCGTSATCGRPMCSWRKSSCRS